MKRILKPVGQCLTTLVMTSAVLEMYPAATAEATPSPTPASVSATPAAPAPQAQPAAIAPTAPSVAPPERSPRRTDSIRATTRRNRAQHQPEARPGGGNAAAPENAATASSASSPPSPPPAAATANSAPEAAPPNPARSPQAEAAAAMETPPTPAARPGAAAQPASAATSDGAIAPQPEAEGAAVEVNGEGDRPRSDRPAGSTRIAPEHSEAETEETQPAASPLPTVGTESTPAPTAQPATTPAEAPAAAAGSAPAAATAETPDPSAAPAEAIAQPTPVEPGRTIDFVNLGRLETAKQTAGDRRSTDRPSALAAAADTPASPWMVSPRRISRAGQWSSPALLACLPQLNGGQSIGRQTPVLLPPPPRVIRLAASPSSRTAPDTAPGAGLATGAIAARTPLQPLIPSSLQFTVAPPAERGSVPVVPGQTPPPPVASFSLSRMPNAALPNDSENWSVAGLTQLPPVDVALAALPGSDVLTEGTPAPEKPQMTLAQTENRAAASVPTLQGKRIMVRTFNHWLDQAGVATPLALPMLLESALDGLQGTRSPLFVEALGEAPLQASPGLAQLDLNSPQLYNLKLAQVGQKLPSLKLSAAVVAAASLPTSTLPQVDLPAVVVPAIAAPKTLTLPIPARKPSATQVTAPANATGDCARLSQAIAVQMSAARRFDWSGMVFPLAMQAPVTSGFGWRIHPISGDRRFHAGVDFGAPQGTPILAAVRGRVVAAEAMGGYGLTVIVENPHLRQRNLYAHMSAIAVRPGDWIEQGSLLGLVGSTGNSTGPHLHFEFQTQTSEGWVAIDPLAVAAQLAQRHRLAANVEERNSIALTRTRP